MTPDRTTHTRWVPLVLIVALFFLWGLANNLNDVLIAHFKGVFGLGDFGAGLVQSAFYLGYFCLAIPAALFMRAYGYRAAVLFGLGLYGAGALLFWPAARALSYPGFLGALFVIASGLAFLETSANPLIARLGAPESAARRLTFAQAFNPLGSITGVLIGRSFILGDVPIVLDRVHSVGAVELLYPAIGLIVLFWAVLIRFASFPAFAARTEPGDAVGLTADFAALARMPRFVLGVIAQFFYVGAQIGVWSFLIRYAQVAMPGTTGPQAAGYLTACLVAFMLGRFLGTVVMTRVRPLLLLTLCAAAGLLCCVYAALMGGHAGILALVACSLFMAIIYPTIFAEAVDGLGPLTKAASAVLVMALIGGAVFPAVMGLVSDLSGSIVRAMLVPAGCFLVVLLFGLDAQRAR